MSDIGRPATAPPVDLTAATLAAVERFNAAFNHHDVDAAVAAMYVKG
jgi:hypothetical protein